MRSYFQKGSPRIFDQLEKNVPYPKGHSTQRREFRSGSKSPAWQRKEGKSASGGLNRKGIASYRRANPGSCLLYTSPSPRDVEESRMPSSA